MTLLIAGYEHEKSLDFSWNSEQSNKLKPEMQVSGLFAIADSAITTYQGGKTLLNGFRKVYELEAKLWKPYFMPDGAFKSYHEIYESREFFIGFAGSTLTAQHILNSITEHTRNLRISYSRHPESGYIEYKVLRHCQDNPLYSNELSFWDDDTFLDKDFAGLLTGEVIDDVVNYSINEALRSAGSYKLSMEEFNAMHTDLVCGVWCPYKKRHELYLYRMLSKRDESGVLIAYTESQFLKEQEIAVLGMRSQFGSRAQEKYNAAISNFTSPAQEMFDFLDECIDEVHMNGSKAIDKPISFRVLNQYKITRRK